jgi:hypothetical protein
MIDAEVNEGGPPSPVPCDTPVDGPARQEVDQLMSEQSPIIKTCPAPDRIVHLPIGASPLPTTHHADCSPTLS